ncbi:MAG: TerC/Alx family metal homeostasis membrane protein [Actinomycetota bacterium]|jgi:tellurite resistance protein TerC|nr:TerC/Alx family metal homeostasis membrane protein [Actinomycetota bacterium]
MSPPLWAWLATLAGLGGFLTGEIVFHRRHGLSGLRPALAESAAWILISVAFGVGLAWTSGWATGGQYFTGYLLEKSLSVDNVLAFALVLRSFNVPPTDQRRVLSYGVLGALGMRGAFIAAGAAFVEHVSWAFYPFGAVVLLAGLRLGRGGEFDVEHGRLIATVRHLVAVDPTADNGRFVTNHDGRWAATPLLLALVTVEATDLVFAADSIPAIFGVTTNVFVVFTSNAFAVLGLRSLYFVLADAMDRFSYLTKGLAVLLVLIGLKMLLKPVVEVPTIITLAVVVAAVGLSAAASWHSKHHPDDPQPGTER